MTDANLDRRLGELVTSGHLHALPADLSKPVTLTETGQRTYQSLYRVAHDRIERLTADWQPEQHPHLRALVTRLIRYGCGRVWTAGEGLAAGRTRVAAAGCGTPRVGVSYAILRAGNTQSH